MIWNSITRVVITGGVHGDEPSGAIALGPLEADGFTTFGPCNPWGLARNVRALSNGRDLNRSFADARCAEASRVREFLIEHPPEVLLDLHEDAGATDPYLIQYGPTDTLGANVVKRLCARYRFASTPRFGPIAGRDGVLCPPGWMVTLVGWSRQWPLVYWSLTTLGCTSIVVEVPGRWSLTERVAFHVAVARATREIHAQRADAPGNTIGSSTS